MQNIRVTAVPLSDSYLGEIQPSLHMACFHGAQPRWIVGGVDGQGIEDGVSVQLATASGGSPIASAYPADLRITQDVAELYGWPDVGFRAGRTVGFPIPNDKTTSFTGSEFIHKVFFRKGLEGSVSGSFAVALAGDGAGERSDAAPTNGLDFEASSNQYVTIAHNSLQTPAGSNTRTWAFWTKRESTGVQAMLVSRNFCAAGTFNWQIYADGGAGTVHVTLSGTSSTDYTTSYTLPTGVWKHLAVVYNGSTVKLYVDAVEEWSTSATGNITNAGVQMVIGDEGCGNYYDGVIADIKYYSDAKSPSDIATIKSEIFSNSLSNIIGYWKLNDGTGSSAADSSGNSMTGTLVNSPTWV